MNERIKRTNAYHSVLRKAFQQPQPHELARNEVQTINEVLNPISRQYETMLSEGVLPPDVIASYLFAHMKQIRESKAHPEAKASAIAELESFLTENLSPHTMAESRFKHNHLPSTVIVHNPHSDLYAGHFAGKRFKPMTQAQLHSHLTTKHKLHSTDASKLIADAKKARALIKDHSSKSVEHAHQALASVRQASKESNPLRKKSLLKITHSHLETTIQHSAKEANTSYHPQLKSAIRSIKDELASHEHRAVVEKFKKRFSAKPEHEASPKDYLHISGHDHDWILSPHDKTTNRRRVVWNLSRHERLK